MNIRRFLPIFGLSLALFQGSVWGAGLPTPAKVLVVYNAGWTADQDGDGVQDSLQIAQYYAQKRGVPSANLLGITLSPAVADARTYTASQNNLFFNDIVLPIRNKIAALGGIANVDVILLCDGVPYGLDGGDTSLDTTLMGIYTITSTYHGFVYGNPYSEATPGLDTDLGHFDHTYKYGTTRDDVIMVTRLDGPSGLRGALEQIDQALYADRYLSPQPGYYQGN